MSHWSEMAPLFPETARLDGEGRLEIGGCSTLDLAARFGTPLYVFDEATLRRQCQRFLQEFGRRHPDTLVIYAAKAFLNPALARLLAEEGLGLDVVSGGEMAVARAAGFPLDKVYFHGNNKSEAELRLALRWGVGRIVVDNERELGLLARLARRTRLPILLRISPGVDPHTHAFTTTGALDSKFGLPLTTGQAEAALRQALASPSLELAGLHFHLGSPIFELEPYLEAIRAVLDFAAMARDRYGFRMKEFSPGGGFAIQYTRDRPPPSPADYAQAIVVALHQGVERLGLEMPRLVVEPGRAIVGRAGVALYTVGAIKDIPGVRKYVALDGGMGDNIRPALYGARYEAVAAGRADTPPQETVTLAGPYCESGDILIRDAALPRMAPGEVIAIPASGAYCLAMASNYNLRPRPAIALVAGGQARLIRRRQSYRDLLRGEL